MGSGLAAASDATVAALRHRGASGALGVAPATPLAGQGFLPGLMANSSAAVDEHRRRAGIPSGGSGDGELVGELVGGLGRLQFAADLA